MPREDSDVVRQFTKYFPKVLFTSEEDLKRYCDKHDPHDALTVQEGEDAPVVKDPRDHKYILQTLVGRNPTTAAFVALQGNNPAKKVVANMKAILDPLLSKNPNDRPNTDQLLAMDCLKYIANLFEEIVKSSDAIEPEDKEEILRQLAASRRRAPAPAAARYGVTNISHEGYLLKYSSDFKWKKRYFAINNGQLRISLSENPSKDGTPPKSVNLDTISDVFPAPEAYCRTHPHQLVIWFTNGQKIIAMAKTEEERDTWISKLHCACGM
eukprot:gene5132-3684_t